VREHKSKLPHWRDERAARRPLDALRREPQDLELVAAMARSIRELYPRCPAAEAERIARHTAERGTGRVGRSAAGRSLEEAALVLAVKAWIRHNHTEYDELLMRGYDRLSARDVVRDEVQEVLAEWTRGPSQEDRKERN
jgi:hypothetical protein